MTDAPMLLGGGEGFGDRALVPASQQQSTDMESVRIQSMDVLAEVVEAAADVVGDIGSITLADIEKLLQDNALSKKDITDAIREALTQPVLPVRDSSVLVRSQVKADTVQEDAQKKVVSTADDWLDDSSGSKESRTRGKRVKEKRSRRGSRSQGSKGLRGSFLSIYTSYKNLVGLMETATKSPLKLIDMSVDLLAKGADKVLGVGGNLLKKGAGAVFGSLFNRDKKYKGGFKDKGDSGNFFGSNDFGASGRGQNRSGVSGASFRSPVQTASVTSSDSGAILNAGPGFVGDDFQAAPVQDVSPFSFFNEAPEPFSGPRGAGPRSSSSTAGNLLTPYPDLRYAQSFGYSILPPDPSMGVSVPVRNNIPALYDDGFRGPVKPSTGNMVQTNVEETAQGLTEPSSTPVLPAPVTEPVGTSLVPAPAVGPSLVPSPALVPETGKTSLVPSLPSPAAAPSLVPSFPFTDRGPAPGVAQDLNEPSLTPVFTQPVLGFGESFSAFTPDDSRGASSAPLSDVGKSEPSPVFSSIFGQNGSQEDDAGVGGGNPFSGLFDFGGASDKSSGSVSTADNLSVDVMESDLRANNALFHTFEEPEKSDFGKFLDFQISGGSGGKEKGQAKGLLGMIFEGFLLAGLLFALPFIVSKVIPFIKGDLIPFIQGPFLEFVKVAAGVLDEIGGTLFDVVIEVIKGIGSWMEKEGVWDSIRYAVTAIGGWVKGTAWPAIATAMSAIWGWVKEAAPVVWNAITGAFEAIAKWIGTNGPGIWDAIKGAATAIGTWVQTEGWPAFSDAMGKFGVFIKETLWPFLEKVAAPVFGFHVRNTFGLIGDIFTLLTPGSDVPDVLGRVSRRINRSWVSDGMAVNAAFRGSADLIRASSMVSDAHISGEYGSGGLTGSSYVFDKVSGDVYSIPFVDMSGLRKGKYVESTADPLLYSLSDVSKLPESAQLVGTVSPSDMGYVYSGEEGGSGGSVVLPRDRVDSDAGLVDSVRDAVITSEGQVIHTDPEDSIYAFKGDVSIAPANSTREFSGSPVAYNNHQSSVYNNSNSSVTNNYNVSQSNFNWSDLLPGSEFDPVGV